MASTPSSTQAIHSSTPEQPLTPESIARGVGSTQTSGPVVEVSSATPVVSDTAGSVTSSSSSSSHQSQERTERRGRDRERASAGSEERTGRRRRRRWDDARRPRSGAAPSASGPATSAEGSSGAEADSEASVMIEHSPSFSRSSISRSSRVRAVDKQRFTSDSSSSSFAPALLSSASASSLTVGQAGTGTSTPNIILPSSVSGSNLVPLGTIVSSTTTPNTSLPSLTPIIANTTDTSSALIMTLVQSFTNILQQNQQALAQNQQTITNITQNQQALLTAYQTNRSQIHTPTPLSADPLSPQSLAGVVEDDESGIAVSGSTVVARSGDKLRLPWCSNIELIPHTDLDE